MCPAWYVLVQYMAVHVICGFVLKSVMQTNSVCTFVLGGILREICSMHLEKVFSGKSQFDKKEISYSGGLRKKFKVKGSK